MVNDLQPGDEATFEVTYTNKCPDSTDWYMENTIEQTLEKTEAAKKVSGTGTAEGGGYTYELTHYDKNNRAEVLFSNEKVGGDTVKENMEGLEQATNALDDWFYIQTLKQGESGRVVIHVAFDGETEVNDYMDTDGGLNVRFAVELTPTTTEKKVNHKIVKTGDNSSLLMWTAIAVGAGIILLILALISRRKEQPEAGAHDVRGRRVDRR